MKTQQPVSASSGSKTFKGSYRLVLPDCDELFECPACSRLLRDDKDFESYHDKGACTFCVDTYYHINADKWDEGWRPDNKEDRKNG